MSDPLPWIRLTKTGASARRLNTLLDYFGTPEHLFAATAKEVAAAARCGLPVAERLLDPGYAANDRDLKLMERLNARLITRADPDYPALLKEIPDPPAALYVRGTLNPADARSIAIVGSRQATDYGKRLAERFARELVEAGITVVSGLAKGLDTAAHHGALKGGGRTVACLGCGVDVVYPYENRGLAQQVVENGALLSEYPMTAPPDAWHFPTRNRIVSGLSLGVVVIEAPPKSGSLITVECALEQNREVFAVPGNVDNFRNRGAHALIKDGAKLVESVEDILAELRPGDVQRTLDLEVEAPPPPQLAPLEATIYQFLGPDPKPIDDLILEAGLPANQVSSTLTMLEIKGVVRRLPGNAYVRLD